MRWATIPVLQMSDPLLTFRSVFDFDQCAFSADQQTTHEMATQSDTSGDSASTGNVPLLPPSPAS